MYDTIIIGAGPAGMSAAIYLVRKRMKVIVLTNDFGGQTAKAAQVENYLGFEKISGAELVDKFQKHMASTGVEVKNIAVDSVQKKDQNFLVKAGEETLETKTVIIASGKTPRKLNVPREKELAGKGVSYCATCDGPLFQNKTVAVIGGGNSALDAAVEMEKYAQKVYILNISSQVQGDEILVERFKKSDKGQIINNAKTTEILGEQTVKGLKYEDQSTKEVKEIACDGIFVEVGWTTSTDFLKEMVKLNQLGEIEIDANNQTSTPGIFACGDVTNVPFKQIVIAAGEAAKAALSAWKYLLTQK